MRKCDNYEQGRKLMNTVFGYYGYENIQHACSLLGISRPEVTLDVYEHFSLEQLYISTVRTNWLPHPPYNKYQQYSLYVHALLDPRFWNRKLAELIYPFYTFVPYQSINMRSVMMKVNNTFLSIYSLALMYSYD